MSFRFDYRAIFIANMMDDILDRDKVLASVRALEEDCKRWGINTERKPIRQLLEEIKEKEEKAAK